jgi:hypothetical protein
MICAELEREMLRRVVSEAELGGRAQVAGPVHRRLCGRAGPSQHGHADCGADDEFPLSPWVPSCQASTSLEKSMVLTAQPDVTSPCESSSERSNSWLHRELARIWEAFFYDVPRSNRVEIEFARPWKTRLGMISLSESGRTTYIGINALLSDPQVPDPVCIITIAHELTHYAHGFGSPLPRKHSHPHHGNVVSQELVFRGLGKELKYYQHWTTHQWHGFYEARANGRNHR